MKTKKIFFLQIGLVIALLFVLLAFNYKSYERATGFDIQVQVDNAPEEIIPITKQEAKPPPPSPPQGKLH